MSPPACVVQFFLPQHEYFKGPTETRAIIYTVQSEEGLTDQGLKINK